MVEVCGPVFEGGLEMIVGRQQSRLNFMTVSLVHLARTSNSDAYLWSADSLLLSVYEFEAAGYAYD